MTGDGELGSPARRKGREALGRATLGRADRKCRGSGAGCAWLGRETELVRLER